MAWVELVHEARLLDDCWADIPFETPQVHTGVMDESRLKETTATTLVGNGYATQESDPCGTKMFGNVRDKARKKRERK